MNRLPRWAEWIAALVLGIIVGTLGPRLSSSPVQGTIARPWSGYQIATIRPSGNLEVWAITSDRGDTWVVAIGPDGRPVIQWAGQ